MIDMNNVEEVTKKLEELKERNLPKMTLESFAKVTCGEIVVRDEAELKAINEYLQDFYDYSDKDSNKSLFTDEPPTLEWGLVHGVCINQDTGLTWKMIHYLVIDGKKMKYEKALQYHPDCYSIDNDIQ